MLQPAKFSVRILRVCVLYIRRHVYAFGTEVGQDPDDVVQIRQEYVVDTRSPCGRATRKQRVMQLSVFKPSRVRRHAYWHFEACSLRRQEVLYVK